jgi:hypothetical protein
MQPWIKRLVIVAVGLAVLGLLVLLGLRFFGKAEPSETGNANTPSAGLPSSDGIPSSGNANSPGATGGVDGPRILIDAPFQKKATEQEVLEQQLLVTARDFAERYGSYSTEGDFANLETLLSVMTPTFRAQTEALIEKNRTANVGAFIGVTTKALSAKPQGTVSASSPVVVRVSTQRTTKKDGTASITYETLSLTMTHSSGVWMVSAASWKTP